MEHGFFHASRGYWQTTDMPDAETMAAYPSGTVEVPLKPGPWYDWTGAAWVPVTPPSALAEERAAMKVSRLQARVAMRAAGIFAAVEAAIMSSENDDMIDAWNTAVEFRRFSPMILALAGQIGLTDTQLDDLFRAAALVDL